MLSKNFTFEKLVFVQGILLSKQCSLKDVFVRRKLPFPEICLSKIVVSKNWVWRICFRRIVHTFCWLSLTDGVTLLYGRGFTAHAIISELWIHVPNCRLRCPLQQVAVKCNFHVTRLRGNAQRIYFLARECKNRNWHPKVGKATKYLLRQTH